MVYESIFERMFPGMDEHEVHHTLISQVNERRPVYPEAEQWTHALDQGKGRVFKAVNPQQWLLVRYLDHSQKNGPILKEDLAESVHFYDISQHVIDVRRAQKWLASDLSHVRPILYAIGKDVVNVAEPDERRNGLSAYMLQDVPKREVFTHPLKYLLAKVRETGQEMAAGPLDPLESYSVAGILLNREQALVEQDFSKFDPQTKAKLTEIVENPKGDTTELAQLDDTSRLRFREGAVVAALVKTLGGRKFRSPDTNAIVGYLSREVDGDSLGLEAMMDTLLSTEQTSWYLDNHILVDGFVKAITSLRRAS